MKAKILLYYNDVKFQPSESFLYKDFGQVPFVLAELTGADLQYWIATSRPNREFKRFRGELVRQFTKHFDALPSRLDFVKNISLYRAMHREEAPTHLVIFPFTPLTDLLVARKARQRGARIIVKLDTNGDYLRALAADWHRFHRHPLRILRQCFHYRELLRTADLVICETSECEKLLRHGFLDLNLDGKLIKTFSGLSETWLAANGIGNVPAAERRQSIVVSGRISSWQKNTALILAAGPPPPGWKIEFVGEVDRELEAIISAYRAADPAFDERYHFHGAINDKRAYFDILMRARALLMNSRGGEGFPNVFAEAHFCRLLIVTSDVSGAEDATGDGRWGLIYPRDDVAGLRAALHAIPERVADVLPPETYRRLFIWEHSLDQPEIRRLFDVARQTDQTGR